MCWAEIGSDGFAVRIIKNFKHVGVAPMTEFMLRATAVSEIRRKIWLRDGKRCTHCGVVVTWGAMELHERLWRGRGGDVSVSNGTTLCRSCHADSPVAGHGSRKVGVK